MLPPTPPLKEAESAWLEKQLSLQGNAKSFKVHPLAGDGSPRPFYRVEAAGQTFVLLTDPTWTLSQDYPAHQKFLKDRGLPVPDFIAWDAKLGLLLMEDLGDVLLQAHLLAHPESKMAWLQKATVLVADLHAHTFPVPGTLPVASRRFDARKYSDELLFMEEHLLKGLFKLPGFTPAEKAEVEKFCAYLDGFTPWIFSHRDYHTRNILVHDHRLRLIDFQDARLGPAEYDLASLFFDPYVPIAAGEREQLLKIYELSVKGSPLGHQIDWGILPERLRAVGLQRMVKAAGSFASFFTRYGKKTHLPYLVPALKTAVQLQSELGSRAPKLPLQTWLHHAEKEAP